MYKRLFILIVALIAVGSAALAARQLNHAPTTHADTSPPAVPVVTGIVRSSDVPIYLRGVGTVIAYNNVIVRSQITGQSIKIAFNQGKTAKKGDLLG
jgi:multidrug efflux system membrane fusion protein